MPLHIILKDITTIECDAIVNAANSSLLGGGGVDGAIHAAAGRELYEECKTLGGCRVGEAKITKGYKLPAKYVIHTVGPIWRGGYGREKELLSACYRNSLMLAKEYGCESIAFPLISSGIYGYPDDKAMEVAIDEIKKFLDSNEMDVYIALLSKRKLKISRELIEDVSDYIDENYEDENKQFKLINLIASNYEGSSTIKHSRRAGYASIASNLSLVDMLSKLDDTFAVTLMKLIDAKGMTDVECYKKANVSKQTWYKIMNEKDYKPSKNTVLSFAIALELNLKETKHLLQTVGFTLSKSNKFDVIIEYFIVNEKYDIHLINETLFEFDQSCLGL